MPDHTFTAENGEAYRMALRGIPSGQAVEVRQGQTLVLRARYDAESGDVRCLHEPAADQEALFDELLTEVARLCALTEEP